MSWPLVRLGDIVFVKGGKRLPKGEEYLGTKTNHPYIRVCDMGIRGLVSSQDELRYISEETHQKIKRYTISCNDVYISIAGTIGVVGSIPKELDGANLTENAAKLVIKNPSELYRDYLVWFLATSGKASIDNQVKATSQPKLALFRIEELEIPLPPLPEQKRIAAILDKADAIRRKRQQAIQLADEFLRAVFLDMFGDPVTNPKGWSETVLDEISDIRSGVTKGKMVDPSTAVTLPYMRVANVQDGYLSLDDVQEIMVSPSDADKCRLMSGDILLTEGGDPDKLGRGHVWNNEMPNCIHQNHIFSVRIKETELIRPEFLSAQISSQRGKRYFLRVGKQTTGIATINKTVLSEFEPLIPPVELQDKYIEISRTINSIKEKTPNENCGLFQALSQKAFVGAL